MLGDDLLQALFIEAQSNPRCANTKLMSSTVAFTVAPGVNGYFDVSFLKSEQKPLPLPFKARPAQPHAVALRHW